MTEGKEPATYDDADEEVSPDLLLPPPTPPPPMSEEVIEAHRQQTEDLRTKVRQWLQRPENYTKKWPSPAQIDLAVEPLANLVAQAAHIVFAGVRITPYRNHLVSDSAILSKALRHAELALGLVLRDAGEDDHASRELARIRHSIRIAMALGAAPSDPTGPGRKPSSWKRSPTLRHYATEVRGILSAAMNDSQLGAGTDEDGVVCRFMVSLSNFFWPGAGATPSTMAKALAGKTE